MSFTKGERAQLHNLVQTGMAKVAVYMKTTMGLPLEISVEKLNAMETLGEQMAFLEAFNIRHPNVLTDLPRFTTNSSPL